MKIGDLINRLNELDPEAYIHLFAKQTKFPISIEREYPDIEYNHNMIIPIPESVIYKDTEGLVGHTMEDWMNSQMVEKVEVASTTDEPMIVDMSEESSEEVLQSLDQLTEESPLEIEEEFLEGGD